jgi:hypothetical protein
MDAREGRFMEGAKLRLYLIPKRIYLKSEPTNSWRPFRSREYIRAAVRQIDRDLVACFDSLTFSDVSNIDQQPWTPESILSQYRRSHFSWSGLSNEFSSKARWKRQ